MQVRNGAMLCYAALVVRMLGFKNSALRGDAKGTVTLPQLLTRYPTLRRFLLQQLQIATAGLPDPNAAVHSCVAEPAAPASGGIKCHPLVHPLLILLTRLRPVTAAPDGLGGAGARASDNVSEDGMAPFLRLVRRCCAAPDMAVRHLAARARCALVPPGGLMHELELCLAVLPQPDAGQQGGSRFAAPGRPVRHIHGALRTLAALLAVNAPSASASSARSALKRAGSGLHRSRCLAAAEETRCPALAAAFADSLRALDACATAVKGPPPDSISDLRAHVLQAVLRAPRVRRDLPAWSVWQRAAVRAALQGHIADCVVADIAGRRRDGADAEADEQAALRAQQQCAALLRHPCMEAAAEALRCLVKSSAWQNDALTEAHARQAWHRRHLVAVASDETSLWDSLQCIVQSACAGKAVRRALQLSTRIVLRLLLGSATGCIAPALRDTPQEQAAASCAAQQEIAAGWESLPSACMAALLRCAADARCVLHAATDVRIHEAALECVGACLGAAFRRGARAAATADTLRCCRPVAMPSCAVPICTTG